MRDILLTGATGVIGRRLVPALVQAGHRVHAVARSPEKASAVTDAGAHAIPLDLFDGDEIAAAVAGRDAVIHLATSIPTGLSMVRSSAWRANDRLRRNAAHNLATAAIEAGVSTYIGESTTFAYLGAGDRWIDESHDRTYHTDSATCVDSERASQRVTDAGLNGVHLRFAMFHDADSSHIHSLLDIADRGFSPFLGPAAAFQSFVDTRDAARAVVAALDVAPGIYNVAECEPSTRGEHATELAGLLGRRRLRSVPRILEKIGGPAAEEMARSQRISCRKLCDASSWEPRVRVIDRWKDLT